MLQGQLDEATDALEAAQRLSEQLDRKEEMIHALREEGKLTYLQYSPPLSLPSHAHFVRAPVCNYSLDFVVLSFALLLCLSLGHSAERADM